MCRHGVRSAALLWPWLLVGAATAHAATEDCPSSANRWIALRLHGPGWTPEFAESVLTDIRAEVAHHRLEVCRAEQQLPVAPMVTLAIEARQPSAMRMWLDIADPLSGRLTGRELQLDSIPVDGRSLAVAVAADELLISGWIKLASRPAPEAMTATPGATTAGQPTPADQAATLAASRPPRAGAARRYELGLLLASDRLAAGVWSNGLDLALRRWLLARWAIELCAGARTESAEEAPHGRVLSRAFPVSVRLLASAVPSDRRARAGVATALTASPFAYHGEASAGATGTSQTALALYLRGDLWADVRWGRARVRAAGGVGVPLRAVRADDTGVAVGGARGLAVHGLLGLMLEL